MLRAIRPSCVKSRSPVESTSSRPQQPSLDKLNGSFSPPFPYLRLLPIRLYLHLFAWFSQVSNCHEKRWRGRAFMACEMKPRGLFRAIVNRWHCCSAADEHNFTSSSSLTKAPSVRTMQLLTITLPVRIYSSASRRLQSPRSRILLLSRTRSLAEVVEEKDLENEVWRRQDCPKQPWRLAKADIAEEKREGEGERGKKGLEISLSRIPHLVDGTSFLKEERAPVVG